MKKLAEELKATTDDLKTTLEQFDDEQFNRVPFEGSWTAGQTAEHIFKSMRGLQPLLMRNAVPAERDPEQHVKMLRDMFLDFTVKFDSAPNLCPSNDRHDRADMENKLLPIMAKLEEIAENEDLTLLCTGFEFPGVGALTRSEMLNFTSAHTQRHIHQLKNIRKSL